MRGLLWLLLFVVLIVGGLAAIVQWPNAIPGGPAIASGITDVASKLGLPWPKNEDKTQGEKLWADYRAMKPRTTNGGDLDVLRQSVAHLQTYVDTPTGNTDVEAVAILSEALVELGQRLKDVDLTASIEAFSRAYALDRSHSAALEGRAWAHHDRAVKVREGSIAAIGNLRPEDDLREAVADFNLALQVALDSERALKDIPPEQTAAIAELTAKAARLPGLYVGRGRAYLAQGHYDEAISDFSEAVALAPTSVAGYQWRGFAQGKKALANDEKDGFALAYADFDQALANAADNQRAEVLLYRAQIRRDDPAKTASFQSVMDDLDEARKLAPSRADVHYEAGLTALQIVKSLDQTKGNYNTCRSGKVRDFCDRDTTKMAELKKALKETAKNESQQARDLEPTNKKYNDQLESTLASADPAP